MVKEARGMKIFAVVCLYILLALTIAAPVSPASAQGIDWQKAIETGKKEGVVVAASSSLGGKAGVAVMNAFREKYGISLELFTGRMAVAQEKIQMEQKSKSYVTDAMDSGGQNVLLLKKAGYLTSVLRDLPVLKEKDKFVGPISEDAEQEMLNILEIYTFLCI